MDNIELRSEKTRNIIGQIPSIIIRIGITVLFTIIIVLSIFAYYFKYPYSISVDGKIISNNNHCYCELRIPAIYINKVDTGQTVTLFLNKISYLQNSTIEVQIKNINKNIKIYSTGAYFYTTASIPISINIKEDININAEIKIGNCSVFERYIK